MDNKKMVPEFKEFDKIPRLNREVVITEKLDGTNACVIVVAGNVDENGESFDDRKVYAQSRNRLITPEKDNYGFAKWVEANKDTLKQLGPGHHYGEWWGNGIQRGYGLDEKRFSLFNVHRWGEARPACCHVVPTLYKAGDLEDAKAAIGLLIMKGSFAAPGFMDPEGIIVWHTAASQYFKVTVKNDTSPKGLLK